MVRAAATAAMCALLSGAAGVGVAGSSARPPAPAAEATRGAVATPVAYQPPVTGPLRVLRGFDPPATPYGPGHLGVDLAAPTGQPIRAAGAGTVTFAGPVAGRGVVVISHADGVRTEYEPVRPLVRRGQVVLAGTPVGVPTGTHPGCPEPACLHWGARRGDAYIDPLRLLTPLGPVRLLPWGSRDP